MIREDTHKKMFFVSCRTTKRGGGVVKPPEPLRKERYFFYDLKKKLPEPHETQEKLIRKYCLLCSVLFNIDQ